VKHRVFPLDDSGSSSAVGQKENETTQPIPAMPRASEDAVRASDATLDEAMPAVPSPAGADPSMVEDVEIADDIEAEEEDDEDDDGGTIGRLISIGAIALLVLGGVWFAWTKFGPHLAK
jgi:hypothetical protein